MTAIPNPTVRAKLLDENAVSRHRNLFCPEYDACLDVAVESGWTSWSCERCPLSARAAPPVLVLLCAARRSCAVGESFSVAV